MRRSKERKVTCGSERNLGSLEKTLPQEVCTKIFSLLDHRSLASSLQVSRAWKNIASEDSLWKKLFSERWDHSTADPIPPTDPAKPWKSRYEAQDRCDRVGTSLKIVREGRDYYIVYRGEIQRLLGSRRGEEREEGGGSNGATPAETLSERILFFLGDLETACSAAGRA